ncbi:hypothetical protein KY308_02300 [Candidatus Woesearchaeota archaeon]|nr:hypothetical protein [Candidatus Woesearchaeota archaeon]
MEKEVVLKELEKLGKEENLPIKELDKELELADLFTEKNDMPEFPLRLIRRRLVDYCYVWINHLHSFLYPNPASIVITKEAEIFDEKEKEEIYNLLAKITGITRDSIALEIKKDSAKDAAFIRDNFEKFKVLRKEIEKLVGKTVEFWKKEAKK